MQVPYAKKWQKEISKLRKIALDCYLTEELKWSKACFTFMRKNVAIIIPLRDSCAFSFFKGALLRDSKGILEWVGKNTQAGRWVHFTSVQAITALQSTLRAYLYQAIELEEAGRKVEMKKPADYAVPKELQRLLNGNRHLAKAFEALTPGRRKSHILHISDAKQAKTRANRAARCLPMIMNGRGVNEPPG